jgi:AraC family transcriptional regulator of arabinose operon
MPHPPRTQLYTQHPLIWASAHDELAMTPEWLAVPSLGMSFLPNPYASPPEGHREAALCYLHAGACTHTLGDRRVTMTAGDLLLIPPYTPNALVPDTAQEWEWYWIILAGPLFTTLIARAGWTPDRMPLHLPPVHPFLDYFHRMLQAIFVQPGGGLIVRGLALELLGTLWQSQISGEAPPHPHTHDQFTAQVISYLGRHLRDEVTLAALAAHFCLSPSRFSRRFQEITGLPPMRYLTFLRIETAKGLLRTTLPIHEIAVQVGFHDHSTFDRAFKALAGLTPAAYRQALH